MQTSIKEEVGVLAMYAVKDSQQSNRYYFYEVYASAKAYEDHRLTPHFQRYISETQDLVEEKLTGLGKQYGYLERAVGFF